MNIFYCKPVSLETASKRENSKNESKIKKIKTKNNSKKKQEEKDLQKHKNNKQIMEEKEVKSQQKIVLPKRFVQKDIV